MTEAGIVFSAIGVVTADPASVDSVLAWASRLGNRVEYLVVENSTTEHADFRYWRATEQALLLQHQYSPAVIQLDYRLPCWRTRHETTASRWKLCPELLLF